VKIYVTISGGGDRHSRQKNKERGWNLVYHQNWQTLKAKEQRERGWNLVYHQNWQTLKAKEQRERMKLNLSPKLIVFRVPPPFIVNVFFWRFFLIKSHPVDDQTQGVTMLYFAYFTNNSIIFVSISP
jgi:hypothetical protein